MQNQCFHLTSYLLAISDYIGPVRGLLYSYCSWCGWCTVAPNVQAPVYAFVSVCVNGTLHCPADRTSIGCV